MRIDGEGTCLDEIEESEKGQKQRKKTKNTGARLRMRAAEIFRAIGNVPYE